MDIKEMIEKVVENIKNDPKLLEEFKADPEKTIEKITGADLPDGIVDKVMATIQGEGGEIAKMFGSVKDKVGGAEGIEKLIDSVEDKVGGAEGVEKLIDSVEEKVGGEGAVGGILDSLKKML